jgi:hypothetical protein
MAILIVPGCWPLSSPTETVTSDLVSAACYRGPEDVGIGAIVVAELKLRDVERHVLGAHLVEGADNATLEDRRGAFNRVRAHGAEPNSSPAAARAA